MERKAGEVLQATYKKEATANNSREWVRPSMTTPTYKKLRVAHAPSPFFCRGRVWASVRTTRQRHIRTCKPLPVKQHQRSSSHHSCPLAWTNLSRSRKSFIRSTQSTTNIIGSNTHTEPAECEEPMASTGMAHVCRHAHAKKKKHTSFRAASWHTRVHRDKRTAGKQHTVSG